MIETRVRPVLAFCFAAAALAACADSPPGSGITAPALPGLDLAAPPPDVGLSLSALRTGRANGHADFLYAPDTNRTRAVTYSFHAHSIGAVTPEVAPAMGELEGTIVQTRTDGTVTELRIHLEVNCLAVDGDEAWIGGLVTRFTRDGVPSPPGTPWLQVRVKDGGEGASSGDTASDIFGSGPQGCRFPRPFPLQPTETGNIQVRPE